MSDAMSYENYTVVELKEIAKNKGIRGYSKLIKSKLIELLEESAEKHDDVNGATSSVKKTTKYTDDFLKLKCTGTSKFIPLTQLGKPGKEGVVYLTTHPQTLVKYAMKTFRKTKSGKTLEIEAYFQHQASKYGISPRIIEYNPEEKYIVMELLNCTLLDLIKKQNGITADQQSQILELYRKLDKIGIMLNDANPLNIMEKDGRLYAIDYGFAKYTTHKSLAKYRNPNIELMPLGLLLMMKDRYPTKNWSIIRNAIRKDVQETMKIDTWP